MLNKNVISGRIFYTYEKNGEKTLQHSSDSIAASSFARVMIKYETINFRPDNKPNFCNCLRYWGKRLGKKFEITGSEILQVLCIEDNIRAEFSEVKIPLSKQDYKKAKEIIKALRYLGQFIICDVNNLFEFEGYIKMLTVKGTFYKIENIRYSEEHKLKITKIK